MYNNYTNPELLENPPEQVILEEVYRNILVDKPRITRFDIKWGDKEEKDEDEFQEIQESTQPQSCVFSPSRYFEDNVMDINHVYGHMLIEKQIEKILEFNNHIMLEDGAIFKTP